MKKNRFLEGYSTYDTSQGYGDPEQWNTAFRARMNIKDAQAILAQKERTPSEILGVPPDASPDVIISAFRKLIMEWHPDRNQHRIAEAEEKSKVIIAAKTVMMKEQ